MSIMGSFLALALKPLKILTCQTCTTREPSCPPPVRPPCGLCFQVRAEILTTYALCGFANFSSIGIMLGGLSECLGAAAARKQEVAEGRWEGVMGTRSRVKGGKSQVNEGQTPTLYPLSALPLSSPKM